MLIHSGQKPHNCTQCDFASSHAHDLRYHIKTHSLQKPKQCKWCEYSTIQWSKRQKSGLAIFFSNLFQHYKGMEGAPYPKFVLRNIWTAPNVIQYERQSLLLCMYHLAVFSPPPIILTTRCLSSKCGWSWLEFPRTRPGENQDASNHFSERAEFSLI